MKSLVVFVIFLFPFAARADQYANYAELSKNEVEGKDFVITARDHKNPNTVLAIHAGAIEKGTGELATVIATHGWNLYLFEGIKRSGNLALHITSTRFDEPKAVALLHQSKFALSIHGYVEPLNSEICIGGANTNAAQNLADQLKSDPLLPFNVLFPCKRFPGLETDNVVNRPSNQGVQLELSGLLRKQILADKKLMDRLAAKIVRALTF